MSLYLQQVKSDTKYHLACAHHLTRENFSSQRLWQRWQCKQLERLASCLLSFPQCASRSARQLALDAFLASCSPTLLHSFHLFAYAYSRQYASITSDFHHFTSQRGFFVGFCSPKNILSPRKNGYFFLCSISIGLGSI